MNNRGIWNRAALILTLMVFLLPFPPCGGAAAAGAAPAGEPLPEVFEQPSLERFALGFSRITGKLREGCAFNALLSVSPGYLPIANRDAANALRQMLAGAQFGYMQRSSVEGGEQSLQILSAAGPLFTLDHRAAGERRVWSCPELLPGVVETPMNVNLFAEILGQNFLGEAVFAPPPASDAGLATRLAPLRRLPDTAGGSEYTLSPETANRLLEAWLRDPAYGALLRPFLSGWSVASAADVACTADERGEWSAFLLSAKVAGPDARIWDVTGKVSRKPGKRQYAHQLDVTLSRDKNDTFHLTGSVVVNVLRKDCLRQALKLNCKGRLNGYSVELRVNGSVNNQYQTDGLMLTEQLDGSYTLNWKTREPALAHLGLDDWKVTLGLKGTLRTVEPRTPPPSMAPPRAPSFEGKLSMVLTRSRANFLSAEVSWVADAREAPMREVPDAELVWESLGDNERKLLDDRRAFMLRLIAGKLMANLDAETQNGILLK